MRYRMCELCGSYAMAHSKVGPVVGLLCLDCLGREDGERSPRQYICSVEGCENDPVFLVAIGDGGSRSLMTCESHFKDIGPDMKTALSVSPWLTNAKEIELNEEGVVILMEMTVEDEEHRRMAPFPSSRRASIL